MKRKTATKKNKPNSVNQSGKGVADFIGKLIYNMFIEPHRKSFNMSHLSKFGK